ncbi:uncharacterized protein CBL_04863 [Carabus blaptoides fortunei]
MFDTGYKFYEYFIDKWNYKQRSNNTPLARKAKKHTIPSTWNETGRLMWHKDQEKNTHLPQFLDKALKLLNLKQVAFELETSVMSKVSCVACKAEPEEICSFLIGLACGDVYNPYHEWEVMFRPVPKPTSQALEVPKKRYAAVLPMNHRRQRNKLLENGVIIDNKNAQRPAWQPRPRTINSQDENAQRPARQPRSGNNNRRNACYGCGREGHYLKDCRWPICSRLSLMKESSCKTPVDKLKPTKTALTDIQGKRLPVKVVQALAMNTELLIGMDILIKFKVNINWSDSSIIIKGARIPLEVEGICKDPIGESRMIAARHQHRTEFSNHKNNEEYNCKTRRPETQYGGVGVCDRHKNESVELKVTTNVSKQPNQFRPADLCVRQEKQTREYGNQTVTMRSYGIQTDDDATIKHTR